MCPSRAQRITGLNHGIIVRDNITEFKVVDYGTIYSGPKNDRKPTKHCFVQFASEERAREFVEKAARVELKVGSSVVKIKHRVSKLNGARNYSLRKAKEMIEKFDSSIKPTIEWSDRCIKVGEDIAFQQGKEEIGGTFAGRFSDLKFE